MRPHPKNNQIPDTRNLHNNETQLYRPATHGAFLRKLLTLYTICTQLTKVNKTKYTILNTNHLKQTLIIRQLPKNPHYLTKNHLFISFFYALLLA